MVSTLRMAAILSTPLINMAPAPHLRASVLTATSVTYSSEPFGREFPNMVPRNSWWLHSTLPISDPRSEPVATIPEVTDVILAPRMVVTINEGDEGILDATEADCRPLISPYLCPFATLACISFRYGRSSSSFRLPSSFGSSATITTAPRLLRTLRTSTDRLRKFRCCSSSNREKTDRRRSAMCVSSEECGMEERMIIWGLLSRKSPLVRTKNLPGRGGMAGSLSWTTSPNNPMELVPGGGEFVDSMYGVTSTLCC
mmetsp:Transcript_16143/g.34898  ORF Transcript_16143/g.34898 Transcript_16143/m.34898 type:complete len:256 (-) Transcript_16143:1215-1982(-)